MSLVNPAASPSSPSSSSVFLGPHRLQAPAAEAVTGGLVERDGKPYYRIAHYDQMPPFLMSIVSDANHWLFLSSTGALTAGRRDPGLALFPYTTDDKIHNAHDQVGSKTILLVTQAERTHLWEPFSHRYAGVYACERTLYKSLYGNEIWFEETNHDLGLTFSYGWRNSDQYGFVRPARLHNHGTAPVTVRLLDGLQNLMPWGVEPLLQTESSTLVDAYKKSELYPEAGLGVYVLSAKLVDKPVPSEALKATTVWAAGLTATAHLLSTRQLDRFRQGQVIETEVDIRAARGAYLVEATQALAPGASHDWVVVAEVDQGPDEVVALTTLLADPETLRKRLLADVDAGTVRLRQLIGSSDGLQATADRISAARHYANVLFNLMRGGVFADNYTIGRADLTAYIRTHNAPIADQHAAFLAALPAQLDVQALLQAATAHGDAQLTRLCYQYLPLTFSRRHGDPSRPWNQFCIDTRTEDGHRKLSYEGNWRDIFQNWEALARAFPAFLESMITTFVNASTPDGYNPYRITRSGIDWEVHDPEDPWSFIGYWGDHQIIYLLKLLELSQAHHPGRLAELLTTPLFAYANVPYRIKPYADLLLDPRDTITYDAEAAARTEARVAAVGADGKLVTDGDGDVHLVNLTEKLLVPMLVKLSNLVPEGGIWMNTQRPEWNDANNALVGYGISVVTLCYLHRYLGFAASLFGGMPQAPVAISEPVATLLGDLQAVLEQHQGWLERSLTDAERKTLLDGLGMAGSAYRDRAYRQGLAGGTTSVDPAALRDFCTLARAYTAHTIRANRRADGLYHAYNLLDLASPEADTVGVQTLYEMLEGQVAVLSAGVLSGEEALDVLQALRGSRLYRADQDSYLLYPDRQLPRFLEKNNIPAAWAAASPLVQALVAQGDRRLVVPDVQGGYHFNGAFHNATDVAAALDALATDGYAEAVQRERAAVLAVFEDLFDHRSYTGRSGTFFGYEGLGSIYWHMVSKLLLAVEETYAAAGKAGTDPAVMAGLAEAYYAVRAGIGAHKSPARYGAVPTDPYSHTPQHAGAQQPGMTGQVKEDILARWGELGVSVEDGCLRFEPRLLRAQELLTEATPWTYFDVQGAEQTLTLAPGTLAFTCCQVPVVYQQAETPTIEVAYAEGHTEQVAGTVLDAARSAQLFGRSGAVVRLAVQFVGPLL